jgi:AraC-like DNA-binding protein
MQFTRIDPPQELRNIVECYWIAVDSSVIPKIQRIIPDGFPELIFHFGDPYRIKLANTWEVQDSSLVAGQISKFFFIENSGTSDMLGIKLKPAALADLFGINMFSLKDKVISLPDFGNEKLNSLNLVLRTCTDHHVRIDIINQHLLDFNISSVPSTLIQEGIQKIFFSHGMVSIASICNDFGVSERQLERLFKKYIGLSPKFYARVIRFSNIFQVAQERKMSWSEVGLESGFYDQPHFIKNFKAFTGEDPSQYFFAEPNLANFFMKKV